MIDKRKTVFSGRVFSVEQIEGSLPSGKPLRADIVRHRPAVVLLPIEDDGRVVLIRQYRAALDRELWELPAGGVDDGERPEAAAARECEEEIGRVPQRIERLGAFFPTPGYCDEEMIFFRVADLQAPPPDSTHRPDEDEEIDCRPVSVADAKAM